MTWTEPSPSINTARNDERAAYDAQRAEQRERLGEATGGKVYTRLDLIDQLRRLSRNENYWLIAAEAALLSQAADELARYDAECFAGRMKGSK